jgi:hypothetical protein
VQNLRPGKTTELLAQGRPYGSCQSLLDVVRHTIHSFSGQRWQPPYTYGCGYRPTRTLSGASGGADATRQHDVSVLTHFSKNWGIQLRRGSLRENFVKRRMDTAFVCSRAPVTVTGSVYCLQTTVWQLGPSVSSAPTSDCESISQYRPHCHSTRSFKVRFWFF